MAGTIIMPSSVQRSVAFRCLLCGKPFFDGEERAYQRHAVDCSSDEDKLDRTRREAAGLLHGIGDEEYEAWVRLNRQAILEGRVRM